MTICRRGIERLKCFFRGHRDVAPAVAYGEALPGRDDQELHYCGACGSPVWVRKARQTPPGVTWFHCGLAP